MGNGDGQTDARHAGSGEDASNVPTETEALITVRLDFAIHRTADFRSRSERIQGFFANECPRYLRRNYCRVFVLADPNDRSRILGFYTLSLGLVQKEEITKQHEKRVMPGLPIPMALVGFMGRDESVSKELKLGAVLLRDAALRIHKCADLTAWGLYLDAENGKLSEWYRDNIGFKNTNSKPLTMYAPLKQLLPGVQGLP